METRTTLDVRSIFLSAVGNFSPWLAAVLLITWSGYPGVVCITPMAWLLATRVGIVCSDRSKSQTTTLRLVEAALAGGLFGLLQGVLFMVITPFMGPIKPEEAAKSMTLTLIMLAAGVLIGAALSLFATATLENRKKKEAEYKKYETIMHDLGM